METAQILKSLTLTFEIRAAEGEESLPQGLEQMQAKWGWRPQAVLLADSWH